MEAEIRVSIDQSSQLRLEPLRNGYPCKVYIPDWLEEYGQNLAYVFEDPHTLEKTVDALKARPEPTGVSLILKSMQRLRLNVHKPLINTHEVNGRIVSDIQSDDSLSLLEVWLSAIQSIPHGHNLCEVQIAFSDENFSEWTAVHRILQQMSEELQKKGTSELKFMFLNSDGK